MDIEIVQLWIEAKPFLSLYGAGFAGMIVHWFKRYSRQQTHSNIYAFFKHNGKATIYSVTTLVGAITIMVQSGIETGTVQNVATAFLAGYNLNSIFNTESSTNPKTIVN